MKILIIEDDNFLLEALKQKLTSAGHFVLTAEDGTKAVDVVMENKIDLVISDLMMPGISGAGFLVMRKKIMAIETPVIVMSVLENAEEILSNLAVDYKFFLPKPIDFEKMLALVSECTKQKIEIKPGDRQTGHF